MPYKDPERRRACNREAVRRLREQRKAAADKLEAAPPGEKPCFACEWRRCTIAYSTTDRALLCRTCARDAVRWMVEQLFSTIEPESQERCVLCRRWRREPANAATVSIKDGRSRTLCRPCAAEVAGYMMQELAPVPRHDGGYNRAA